MLNRAHAQFGVNRLVPIHAVRQQRLRALLSYTNVQRRYGLGFFHAWVRAVCLHAGASSVPLSKD
eukprot:6178701-Pleurochrysis_carterae.AAC.1